MKDMNMSAASVLCPICGEGHVTDGMAMTEYAYKDKTTALPLRFTTCDTCGSESAGLEESRANKRVAMAFRKSVDGLLTGAEICALRDKYKLTQTQAAKLFGGGPVAFSKYENDDVSQSESMDSLLRLVRRSEASFWELVEEKGMSVEFVPAKLPEKAVEMPRTIGVSTTNVLVMADYRDGGPKVTVGPAYTYVTEPDRAKKWG